LSAASRRDTVPKRADGVHRASFYAALAEGVGTAADREKPGNGEEGRDEDRGRDLVLVDQDVQRPYHDDDPDEEQCGHRRAQR
jgi:hypothetical protein